MKWILSLLLLVSFGAIGQIGRGDDSTKYIRYQNQYGMRMPRSWWDSVAHMPYGDTTTFPKPCRPGALMMHTDKVFYKWNGGGWDALGGAPTTASNGLIKVGNDIQLGGILTQDTKISGGATGHPFRIDSTASISFFSGLEYVSSGIGSFIQMSDSVMNIGSTSAADFTSFVFSPTRIKFTAADGAGTSGDVWTNTGSGYGHWEAATGGGSADSTIFSTNYRRDTAIANVRTQLAGKQPTGNYITALTGDLTATGPGSVAGTISANAVTNAKLAQAAALTIKGNPTNATANEQDIAAGTDNQVLRRSGTSLGFGAVNIASNNAVTGNLPVTNLNNGTSATRNTVWTGNGAWESTGAHTFFKVDEVSFPADGDSIYSNASLAGYQHYNIYREGVLQYMDTTDGVEIDTATGTITYHPPLVANERVQINADKLQPLRGQPFVQFDVNTVPNVRAWFDATDATTVTVATGVSVWADKTPNNNDMVQGSGSAQPLYSSTGGSGNQAYIRFNSSDALNRTFPVADSAAITMYMVVKQATYTNSYVQYSWGNTAGPDGLIPSVNSDPASVYWGYGNYDGSGQNSANLNTGWGDWQLVKSVFRGGNNCYVTKNKEGAMKYIESPEGIGAGSPGTLKNEHILFQYAYDPWDISEAVLITGEPSTTNDNNIKSYLMSKYQIPAKKMFIMLGDSHTQGIESGTTTGRAYYLTTAKDQGYDVMNMGISGTVAYPIGSFGGMTGKNLSDIYTQFDQYIAPNNPYVIFQYGTNDGTSPVNAAWVTSYKASIQHFLDAGVPANKIIICSPPYTTSPTYGTNVANAVPVIAGIASDLGIQFCDFYTNLQGLSLDCYTVPGGDGIHGNLAIHNAMADLLKTFLP